MNALATAVTASLPRFVDNGDGTSTDTKTGLVWFKATLGDGRRMTYAQALEAIAALGPEYRMPEFDELHSLVDRSRFNPAIDTEIFADTKSGAYWSSTDAAWNRNPNPASRAAWVVFFGLGYSSVYIRDDNYAFVRAVRSVPAGQ